MNRVRLHHAPFATGGALPPPLLSVYDLAGRPGDAWDGATRAADSLLGARERAVALLRESFADGRWYPDLPHGDPAFAGLRDTPSFRAVIRPRN